ncbi:MAG: hypothetical protein IT356_12885 [Gemmatimonadaceae bacterium]|nr:hypothetical protein [Gemmatimonadaceae bacterium]
MCAIERAIDTRVRDQTAIVVGFVDLRRLLRETVSDAPQHESDGIVDDARA